eukprot:TRINITY_DN58345_c0_g1_i1.p1 TRINITY_DN58345_c0_g1~~TRINITY_DN58345_c0_g1_i1.p1  ORF type:complete len:260 (-),score=29.48 TRINITY_DN58345_c0_g1_i1:51-743(-)
MSAAAEPWVGVYSGTWGAAPHLHHPRLPVAQVTAAATMFVPLAIGIIEIWGAGCTRGLLDGSRAQIALLTWVAVMPASIANHLGHAINRRWIPALQKLDRASIVFGSALGSFALSGSYVFSAVMVVFGVCLLFAMYIASPKYSNNENLATACTGLAILYSLLPMYFFRDELDPYLLPSFGIILTGFGIFQFDPFGVWTDSIWHLILGGFLFCNVGSAILLDRRIHGDCGI